jgi:hypothetical protein
MVRKRTLHGCVQAAQGVHNRRTGTVPAYPWTLLILYGRQTIKRYGHLIHIGDDPVNPGIL